MRKITQNSINAFMQRSNFSHGNMAVRNETTGAGNVRTDLFLHGNRIATMDHNGQIMVTDAGWSTRTTKERLNGIPGVNICQQDFVWYLNGKAWNGELTAI